MIGPDRTLIVVPMKNEGPYILEWVAHNLSVGIDGFLVFTNDCDDLTDRILDRLARLIPVQHQPNPKPLLDDAGNWHVMALRYGAMFNIYKDAGYIYFTDADEFLQVHVGDGTLDALAQATGPFDALSLTSMPFNSNGVLRLVPDFVTAQFTEYNKRYARMRARGASAQNAVKTMFRNDVPFDLRRNHRPVMTGFSASGRRWIDGSGRDMPPAFTDGLSKGIEALGSTDLAQFNHYAIKSAEAFLVKVDRGDAVGTTRLDRSRDYWESYNTPGMTERRFAEKSAAFRRIHAELLADPLLAEMHEESFHRHQAKVARILATPSGQEKAAWLGLSAETR